VFKVDDHLGIACSGLISDGRVLCRYMRNECVNHRFVYDSPMAVSKLVGQVAAGDHTVFVGEVKQAVLHRDGAALDLASTGWQYGG
jgi:hypothetical protein